MFNTTTSNNIINNDNNNSNNNDWNLNADVLNNVGSIIIAVKGLFPHPVGGIIL